VSVDAAGLAELIERPSAAGASAPRDEARQAFAALRGALSRGNGASGRTGRVGAVRLARERWVKRGILLGFKFGETVDMSADHGRWPFFDKDTLPLSRIGAVRRPRSSRRIDDARRRLLGRGVICMPPMYVNIGAYVGDETLIDSHALVGSCAQVGARVHVSAAAQIGGVHRAGRRAAGDRRRRRAGRRQLRRLRGRDRKRRRCWPPAPSHRSTPIYDLPNERIIEPARAAADRPEGAVVVPGTRR
jgi:2,3,4,5-tetrahydropyridine-2-carboxylate N-succinyltransferase